MKFLIYSIAFFISLHYVWTSNPKPQPSMTEKSVIPKPPQCTNPREVFSKCSAHCQDTCDNYGKPHRCDRRCIPGCVCIKPFVRNNSSKCVEKYECPKQCPKHEHWEPCPGICPRDSCAGLNCNYKCPQLPAIPLPCQPDCVCDQGYLRNPKGICGKKETCPLNQTCGVNELYNHCVNVCEPKSCKSLIIKDKCLKNKSCTPGCDCLPGHLRNKYGQCIRKEQCPEAQECGINESYQLCSSHCPKTCKNRYLEPPICIQSCKEGCACNPGFIRHDNGTCVLPSQCSIPECPSHSKYNRCGSSCPATCDNRGDKKIICTSNCKEGCSCEPGYVKNGYNCVKPQDCPQKCKNPHEVFSPCSVHCQDTCDNFDRPHGCDRRCRSGCVCEKPFVRNSNGDCVQKKECPLKCNKPHEIFSPCSVHCQDTCDNYNKPHGCDRRCRSGCVCEKPFVRNSNGDCVQKKECPLKCKKPHEIFSPCSVHCQDTCDNYDKPHGCDRRCRSGCVCEKPFVRNSNGDCVQKKECPKKCKKPHEIFSPCSVHCQNTCDNYDKPHGCDRRCRSGCVCEKPFVRNSNGDCVQKKECPKKCKKPHEIFSPCSVHCQDTCDNYDKPHGCDRRCRSGCVCEKPFVRNSNGDCVQKKECRTYKVLLLTTITQKCKKPHEVFSPCSVHCQNTCDNYDRPHGCDRRCRSGCVCEKPFVRNSKGDCVQKNKCPPKCYKNHEVWSLCNANCQNTCDNYQDPKRLCTRICKPGCICEYPYVRNYQQVCVTTDKCCLTSNSSSSESSTSPASCDDEDNDNYEDQYNDDAYYDYEDYKNILCPIHEKWVDCEPNVCIPKYCDDLGYELNCPHIKGNHCPGGCICKQGYLRNARGVCIPIGNCLSCHGDRNATSGCGNHCGNRCSDFLDKNKKCGIGCIQNGCNCRKDYVYNDNLKQCVLPQDCPCTDINAERASCGTQCPATCSRPNPTHCIFNACIKNGCNCKRGYVLSNVGGICIKISNCPAHLGCNGDKNATIKSYPNSCIRTCDVPNPKVCTALGVVVGCECNPGYIKVTRNGPCIKITDCSGNQGCNGDKNATIVEQPNSCPPTCDLPKPITCIDIGKPVGCQCKPGYIRANRTGPCIKLEDCKACKDPNAERVKCASNCPATCAKPNPGPCTAICIKNSCACKRGYILSKTGGKCIKINECPAGIGCDGDKNATIKESISPCPPTCQEPNPKACPTIIILSGCQCNPGYIKSKKNGPCIAIKDCKAGIGCNGDKNATIKEYASPCPPTCDEPNPKVCPKTIIPLGCQCNLGYIKSKKNGPCIAKKDCKACKDPNAERVECASNCPGTCAKPNPGPCKSVCIKNGCACKRGYILSKTGGKCIKINECPANLGCNGDKNAIIKQNVNPCPPTCDQPQPKICPLIIIPVGCECKPGYVKSNRSGSCVRPSDCKPGIGCNGDKNATIKENASPCPPTCDEPNPKICPKTIIPLGCQCNPGYIKSKKNGPCIALKDCKACKDPNAEQVECASNCPGTCAKPNPGPCTAICIKNGCACKRGYILSKTGGKCIKINECPANLGCNGDKNAIIKQNVIPCPPTCDQPQPKLCPLIIIPVGCECKPGYVKSNRSGSCIKPIDCKDGIGCNGDKNATIKENVSPCPPTCEEPNPKACPKIPFIPLGCQCNPGYIKSKKNGPCIALKDCKTCKDVNAERVECASSCPPTCAIPNPRPCKALCIKNGCACKQGYILSKIGGKCIKIKECPAGIGCNGDKNSTVKEYVSPCPPTCEEPNPKACPKTIFTLGCQCNPGYIKSKKNGPCIAIKDCTACKDPNAELVECASNCPGTCAKPNPGPCTAICIKNGCACKRGYILSKTGGKCIKINECPANLGCNGDKNAIIKQNVSPCPPTCDQPQPKICPKIIIPVGCECKPGYVKSNRSGSCIKPSDCKPGIGCNGDKNATIKESVSPCPPTCEEPNPKVCPTIIIPLGCQCNQGYIQSKKNGPCIALKDCKACKDVNAERVKCASGCPPTCANPNPIPCKALCINNGCACKHGYILSKIGGECIKIKECPDCEN